MLRVDPGSWISWFWWETVAYSLRKSLSKVFTFSYFNWPVSLSLATCYARLYFFFYVGDSSCFASWSRECIFRWKRCVFFHGPLAHFLFYFVLKAKAYECIHAFSTYVCAAYFSQRYVRASTKGRKRSPDMTCDMTPISPVLFGKQK